MSSLAIKQSAVIDTLKAPNVNTMLGRKATGQILPSDNKSLVPRGERSVLYSLPTELLLNIFAHLSNDPVSQMCLGLTGQRLHAIFHSIHDYTCPISRVHIYNVKTRPWDLRMTVSLDGTAILYGWDEFHNELYDSQTYYHPSLADLLIGELWLWRGLGRCESCLKYKPESAWKSSDFEYRLLRRHQHEIDAIEGEDFVCYSSMCGRCRAKQLLVSFEGRKEAWEDDVQAEVTECLGLWLPERLETHVYPGKFNLPETRRLEGKDGRNFEPWNEVFDRLGI